MLASGSDGNCTVVVNDGEAVMIDAGLNCKALCKLMDTEGVEPKDVKAMLLSHEHTDHVCGARVFAKKFDVPMYCTVGTYEGFDHGD